MNYRIGENANHSVRTNKLILTIFLCGLFFINLAGCTVGNPDPTLVGRGSDCKLEDYTLAKDSPFILPYEIGREFRVEAGNCGGVSHSVNCSWFDMRCGDMRYATDFTMRIGTPIVATHDGKVIALDERHADVHSVGSKTNYVIVQHPDGTAAQYVHLKKKGVIVEIGDQVKQGDIIAMSGNSGWVAPNPHLHFVVYKELGPKCNGPVLEECASMPVTFNNAEPLDTPLIEGKTYKASHH